MHYLKGLIFKIMIMYDLSRIKRLKAFIEEIDIITALPFNKGWLVFFRLEDGRKGCIAKARTKEERIYKSTDTAIKDIEEILLNQGMGERKTKISFNLSLN